MGGDARGAMEYLDGAAGDAQVDLGADQRVRHRASHSTKSAGLFRRAKKAHTAATWAMQCSADLWQAAGMLGMTVEMLQERYGHHHPDFQRDVANKLAGRGRGLGGQDVDRLTVNKTRQTASNADKNR
jgi:hypothetical protein